MWCSACRYGIFAKTDINQIPICRTVAYTSWVAFQCNFATQCNPYRKLRLLPAKRQAKACLFVFCGFERRLLATVRGTVATAVAFPQKSESIVINRRLTEVPMIIEASLSLLEIQPCTLKTEHCDYDAIMRRQQ